MKYKAVIFDLDGTLLDTLEDLSNSLNRVLRDKGLPTHPIESFRNFVGNGSAMLVSRALPSTTRNDRLIADCLDAFLKEYSHNWNVKTKPYLGIPKLLDILSEKHIRMAVLTNKPQHFADLCIQEFFSGWNCNIILGQRDEIPMKPDPVGAREIARIFDVPSTEIIFLGDSHIDMQTAVSANMLPVGVAWGFSSTKELQDSGAVKTIRQPIELLSFIR